MSDVVGITGKHQSKLKRMEREADVPQRWHNTPVNALIAAQNFNHPVTPVGTPQILIATCIDFRLMPKVPPAYAYVIRVATGRLIGLEFALTYGIAEGVKHVALIGHDDCGMTKISQHGPLMIDVLVDQGWDRERAEEYVASQAVGTRLKTRWKLLRRSFSGSNDCSRKWSSPPCLRPSTPASCMCRSGTWTISKSRRQPNTSSKRKICCFRVGSLSGTICSLRFVN